jgi:hypothetical protein
MSQGGDKKPDQQTGPLSARNRRLVKSQDESKKKDALVLLAKAALADRRRRFPLSLVVTLLLLLLGLGGLAWWIMHRPGLPALTLAAFDQVALPDQTVRLAGRVEPIEAASPDVNLAGCDLYFQGKTGEALGKIATGPDGMAGVERSFPAADQPMEFLVRYPGEENRRRGSQATGRVFVWPPNTALLVVDADHALATVAEPKLWTTNNLDLRPQAGAAAALRSGRGKYRIVYLTAAADRPMRYNKLRAWLERGAPVQEQFPDGPVLSRAGRQAAAEPVAFQRAILSSLKERYQGTVVAVAGRAEEGRLFHELGLKTYLVGDVPDAPEGVVVVKTWAELGKRLAE